MTDNQIEFSEDFESDVEDLAPQEISEAVVYATDWTTETLLSQLERGNIQVNPRFQRRDAWTLPRKSRFIESLILGLPIPQIVLAERRGERGKYLVLDGKQRLLTLQQFVGAGEGANNGFSLKRLEVRSDLDGRTHADLVEDPDLDAERSSFENQTIRTVVIRGWSSIDFLHLVFVRLNTGSVPLSPQELRQALFPGPFVDHIDDYSFESEDLQFLLGRSSPDFRMRDVELLVRYIGFALFMREYRGNMKAFLDMTCERLNDNWADAEGEVLEALARFEQAVQCARDVFGDDAVGRKWNEDGPERARNRAVLDVQLYYFSDLKIAQGARDEAEAVAGAFRRLVIENENFRTSVEATTKSIGAVRTRFQLWAEELGRTLGVDVDAPIVAPDVPA